MTTLSLELRGTPGITMNAAPQGFRSWLLAGTALASGVMFIVRKRYSDGIRRRVIRRLDIIAPRKRIDNELLNDSTLFNTDCPICLCDLLKLERGQCKWVRILDCGHALCASCLEAWATHCTKAHLNPCRFGITRNGRVISWTPGPKCPLCCARLNCVPKEDLKQAIIAAIGHRGVALSTYVARNGNSGNHHANSHHTRYTLPASTTIQSDHNERNDTAVTNLDARQQQADNSQHSTPPTDVSLHTDVDVHVDSEAGHSSSAW